MSIVLQPDRKTRRKPGRVLAHSRLDSLLVALPLVQLALLLYGVRTLGSVPWGLSVGLGLLASFLMWTNYMCVAHNFIHNPFFVSKKLNAAFSLVISAIIGIPHSLYRIQHLHHHKYNNDAPDPRTGTTRDVTSIWRYSKRPGQEESLLAYALLGFFRSDFGMLISGLRGQRLMSLMRWELTALVVMVAVFGFLNPLGLVAFYLPVWVVGTIAAQAENYFEHHGAIPGNRMTDSVSSYGWLYNLIWFNNGYHQEHHYRPQTHWTQLPKLKPLLPPETERCVVPGAHWFNFLSRRTPEGSSRPGDKTPLSPAGRGENENDYS